MKEHRSTFPVVKMSEALNVSLSGFYDWEKRTISHTQKRREQLQIAILDQYKVHGGMAGSPTITADLNETDEWKSISQTRVAREMQSMNLRCKTVRKFTITTDSKHNEPIAPNTLARNFEQKEPNKVWVSDITYIRVNSHWVYLVVFIDLFNKKVVGWDLSSSLAAASTIQALEKAVWIRNPPKGLLIHSDRGIQYACGDFRKKLKEFGFKQSMSRKGNCWDNACAESFFGRLKTRLTHHRVYESMAELQRDLYWYIEIYYNRYRKHSSNNGMTPDQKELNFKQKQGKCA
jgi:putative transposase